MTDRKKLAKRAALAATGAVAGWALGKKFAKRTDFASLLRDLEDPNSAIDKLRLSGLVDRLIESFDHDLSPAEKTEVHRLLMRPAVLRELIEYVTTGDSWPHADLQDAAFAKIDSLDRSSKDALQWLRGFPLRTSMSRRQKLAYLYILKTSNEELVRTANTLNHDYPLADVDENTFNANYDARIQAYGLQVTEDEFAFDAVRKHLTRKEGVEVMKQINSSNAKGTK